MKRFNERFPLTELRLIKLAPPFLSKTSLKVTLLTAVAITISLFFTAGAFAACNIIISLNSSDLYYDYNNNGFVCVNNGVTVDGYNAIKFNQAIGMFLENSGFIGPSDDHTIIVEDSELGSISNDGLIINNQDYVALLVQDYNNENTNTIIGSIVNHGTIEALSQNGRGVQIIGSTISNGIINTGNIQSGDRAIDFDYADIDEGPKITSNINGGIINSGLIQSLNEVAIEFSDGSVLTDGIINNKEGRIIGKERAISIDQPLNYVSSEVDFILNEGLISSDDIAIRLNHPSSKVGDITNIGLIDGRSIDIKNIGSIIALNNYQGSNGSGDSALTYSGNLPDNYNMIVYGDRYGQLAVDLNNHSGQMTFGIFGGYDENTDGDFDDLNDISKSNLNKRVYEDVVTGVTRANYSNTFDDTTPEIISFFGPNGASFGNYHGDGWVLTDATWRSGTNTQWDLTFFDRSSDVTDIYGENGAAVGTTNGLFFILGDKAGLPPLVSLDFGKDLADPQRNMLEQRQLAIRNGLDYDCKQFNKDGICVSLKGRYSSFDDYNEGAGILVVSKRLDNEVHFGGFIDQRMVSNEVNGITNKDSLPMFGIFADFSDKKSGEGAQARISTGLHRGTIHISRSNILGDAATASGKANVDSFGVRGTFGWGFAVGNKQVLTPYIGVSFLKASRAAYNEASATGVLDPLSYASYSERRTIGSVGLKLTGPMSESLSYRLGVGIDYDPYYHIDSFDVTSAIVEEATYSNNYKPRELRINGSASLDYAIDTNKTLIIDGNVSQMDYGNLLAYSFIAGFQMGF